MARSIACFRTWLRRSSRFFLISNPSDPPRSRAFTHRLATPARSGITSSRGKFSSCSSPRMSSWASRRFKSASETMAASACRSRSDANPSGPITGTPSAAVFHTSARLSRNAIGFSPSCGSRINVRATARPVSPAPSMTTGMPQRPRRIRTARAPVSASGVSTSTNSSVDSSTPRENTPRATRLSQATSPPNTASVASMRRRKRSTGPSK